MANVVFKRAFDMSGADIVKYTGGEIDSQTTSSEHLSNGKYTASVTGEQNFYATPGGEITGFSGQHRTESTLVITNLSITNQAFTDARNDAGQVLDLLFGGNDQIQGSQQNDTLSGFNGDDLLKGNNGDDVLAGNHGADRLVGGKGADTFVFETAQDSTKADKDLIVDYRANDKIDLTAFDLADESGIFSTYRGDKDITTVHVDTNHDGKADLIFSLDGDHRTDIDFVL